MENIIEILKGFGIELPEEKNAEFTEKFNANYKTVAEFDKKVGKLTTERDDFKGKFETAQETLKGFEGIDKDAVNTELEGYRQKIADMEAAYNAKEQEREYTDALNASIAGYTFTSNAAKAHVMGLIKEKGLKVDGGKLLGFDDAMKSIKEAEADAFADDEGSARFTSSMGGEGSAKYTSREDIMKIKNRAERLEAIKNNKALFGY